MILPPVQTIRNPEVTVVIPTRNRCNLVARAIRSALQQSFTNLEVVVVVDGPDPETISVLRDIQDDRLRWIEMAQTSGGSSARNAGASAALGRWIAFLDDDDEWFAQKIQKQLALANASSFPYPIVCSRLIARGPKADAIWPRKTPRAPVSEYLFCRSSLFQGEGLIQTSSLLTTRDLLQAVPFKEGLRKHQDWDWLLRALDVAGSGIEFEPEPLLIWNTDQGTESVSSELADSLSRDWLRANRRLFTRRAYAGFLLTVVTPQILQGGNKHRVFSVVWEAFAKGSPRLIDLLLFLGFCAVPKPFRYFLRIRFS
jgi:glycosyltransferase involved in cell wall biosynthesis